jgi:HEAT repeat protein
LVQLCFALEKLRSRRFVPALILALRTGSESLRAAAAQALGGVGGQRALAALSVSVREDPDAAAREAAAYALRWFDGEAATAVLVTVLNDSLEVPRVRATAAESCNHYGPSAAMPHLIRALRDQSPEVRFWAAFALGQMGAAEALEELERLIATDTAVVEGWWSVKKEAADAKRAIVERIGDSHMT